MCLPSTQSLFVLTSEQARCAHCTVSQSALTAERHAADELRTEVSELSSKIKGLEAQVASLQGEGSQYISKYTSVTQEHAETEARLQDVSTSTWMKDECGMDILQYTDIACSEQCMTTYQNQHHTCTSRLVFTFALLCHPYQL